MISNNIVSSLKEFLKENWRKAGFKDLTIIQQRAIPVISEGNDLIAESPTGTGKTLAYVLPILNQLDDQLQTLQTVILTPTRELAMQIFQVIHHFSEGSNLFSVSLIGGADIRRQIEKLKKKPQIVVGTPGRIQELIQSKKLKMHEVRHIIADEVDQMVEMGLAEPVSAIVKATLKDRQIIFFSATIPPKVEQLGRSIMDSPEIIRVSKQEAPSSVEHFYVVCDRRDKIDTLRKIIKMEPMKALVFVNDTGNLAPLLTKITYSGIELDVLHSQAKKTERETVIKNYKSGKFPVLIATDVAARGLDIQDLSHVIHFDFPMEVDQYIHRSGRTGRMGAAGKVISIITPNQENHLVKLANKSGISIKKRNLYMGKLLEPKKH